MRHALVLSALLVVAVCGCDSSKSGGSSAPSAADSHEHLSEGPHHGTLVELGNEEYHAEVVHTADTVTVYILDSHAQKSVPIDATEVTINVVHEGKPEQFKLSASPDAGDSDGKCSRFTTSDAELAGHIDDSAAAPKLSLMIGDKPYRGEIKHDHAGHDHDHGHAH